MPTLRRWQFAIATVILLLIATAAGFYIYAKHRADRTLRELPGKLAANIAQKAVTFTYSKSEGGRTIFTIKASELIQFKDGIHAELHNVSILVYGQEGDRYDQIYGDKFSYDQKTQQVRADGPVSIDLQANPKAIASPTDQPVPEEIKNPLHLKTSGLVFSQATGIAQTAERIEFRTAQGEGSAVGAIYDTHNGIIRFEHDVSLTAFGQNSKQTVLASSAVFSEGERQQKLAKLEEVIIRNPEREVKARKLDLYLRPDNTLDHISAPDGIASHSLIGAEDSISANSANFLGGDKNQITRADLHGNVHVVNGNTTADASSAILHLAANDQLRSADLTEGATIRQPDGSKLESQTLHLDLRNDRSLERATTPTSATITLIEAAAHRETHISADRMDAAFDPASHIRSLHAAPNVKVVSTDPKASQRTTTSAALDATFTTVANKTTLARIIESGNVRITEGERTATAVHADYDPQTQRAVLTGSPRIEDAGMSISAQRIQIEQASDHATAEGDVRVTYTNPSTPKAEAAAMFSGSQPTHAIAAYAELSKRSSGSTVATFTGTPARLWQEANFLQAPQITLDRESRALAATGTGKLPVTTSFVQQDKDQKLVPVTVTAHSLHYSDDRRRADFEGNVTIRGADATITAQQLSVLLLPPGSSSQTSAGQIDQILASGNVTLDEPGRHGSGDRLLYTSNDAKFVLTGTPNVPPSIFDAEHGSVTGDSLTFYSRDDRVLVESHGKRTVTHTKLISAK